MQHAAANGTASSAADFASASGKLTFAPGETEQDRSTSRSSARRLYEQDETLTVSLSGPVQATIGDGSATGTITNDDPAFRTGSYAGQTGQGKPISFDVTSDAKGVMNVMIGFDLNCTEVQGFTIIGTLEITGTMSINPDGTFGLNDTYSEPGYREKFGVPGKLTAPSSGGGGSSSSHRIEASR